MVPLFELGVGLLNILHHLEIDHFSIKLCVLFVFFLSSITSCPHLLSPKTNCVVLIFIFLGQLSPRGKGAMRLSLYEAPTQGQH